MSKVYIKLDSNNVITDINSSDFLKSTSGYTKIAEGQGDKYSHAQTQYLAKGLVDEKGRFNYKYVNSTITELTESEKNTLCSIPKDIMTSQGSDYGEVGKWDDGNPNNEDRLYRFVTIVGDNREISIANSESQIVGTSNLSENVGFIGNYQSGVDSDKSNVVVSIMGVSYVKTNDSTIKANDRVMSDDNGYAVKSSNNLGYRVLKVVSSGLLEIVVSPNTDMIQRIKSHDDIQDAGIAKAQSDIDNLENKLIRNLLKPTLQTQTQNGVTFTNNGDGTYTLNGTATKQIVLNITNIFVNNMIGNILLGCPSGGSASTYNLVISYYDEDNSWLKERYDIGNGITLENYPKIQIVILIRSGATCNNLVFKPMITTDLNATYDDFISYDDSLAINKNKVEITDIVDNVTSTNTDKPLSANQGKVLNDNINSVNSNLQKNINTKQNKVLYGTSEPTSSQGSDGDIYIMIE